MRQFACSQLVIKLIDKQLCFHIQTSRIKAKLNDFVTKDYTATLIALKA